MLYRAFGKAGPSVSVLTLRLSGDFGGRSGIDLVYAALESGVNGFELCEPTPDAATTLGQALGAIDRPMAVVMLRIGGGEPRGGARTPRDFRPDAIASCVGRALDAGAFGHFDLVLLDDPQPNECAPDTVEALTSLRQRGCAALIGVSGAGPVVESALATGALGAQAAVYNLRSGPAERTRISAAAAAGRVLIGERFHPRPPPGAPTAGSPPARGFLGLGRRVPAPIERSDGYAFLTRTPGWRSDEICLRYALTEPAISTVLVDAETTADIVRLAAAAERSLPSGTAAQIEMARFTAVD